MIVEFSAELDGVLTATDTDSRITAFSLYQFAFAKLGIEEEVNEVMGAVFMDEPSGMLPKIKGAFSEIFMSFSPTWKAAIFGVNCCLD